MGPNRTTLGIKHKNYLNVKQLGGAGWKGSTGADARGHAIFSDAAWGLRAAIRNLWNYWSKRKRRTLAAITAAWAPASDTIGGAGSAANRPKEYAAFLAGRLGAATDEPLKLFRSDGFIGDRAQLEALLRAMAAYENYAAFRIPDDELARGIELYLGEPA